MVADSEDIPRPASMSIYREDRAVLWVYKWPSSKLLYIAVLLVLALDIWSASSVLGVESVSPFLAFPVMLVSFGATYVLLGQCLNQTIFRVDSISLSVSQRPLPFYSSQEFPLRSLESLEIKSRNVSKEGQPERLVHRLCVGEDKVIVDSVPDIEVLRYLRQEIEAYRKTLSW